MTIGLDPSAPRIQPQRTTDILPDAKNQIGGQPAVQNPDGTWKLKDPATQRRVVTGGGPAGVQALDPKSVAAAYANVKHTLDGLEAMLQGTPDSMRKALADGLSGKAPMPAGLEAKADAVRQTVLSLRQQLDALPDAGQKQLTQLLAPDESWKLSEPMMKAFAAGEPSPAARTAPALSTPAEKTAYGNIQKAFGVTEAKLKTATPDQLQRLEAALTRHQHVPDDLKPFANAVADASDAVDRELGKLPDASNEKVAETINANEQTWPLTNQILTAAENAQQSQKGQPAPTGLSPAGVAAFNKVQSAFDQLEKHLGALPGGKAGLQELANDVATGKPFPNDALKSAAFEAVAARNQLESAMVALPKDQQAAIQRLLQADQTHPRADVVMQAIDANLSRQTNQRALPALPNTPQMPTLSRVVAQTVQDGRVDMPELAAIIDSMVQDKAAAQRMGGAAVRAADAQANALSNYVTAHAQVDPKDQPRFQRVFQDMARAGSNLQQLEQIAQAIANGNY